MASGSFNLTRTSGSEYVLFWIEYSETTDISSNTSQVTATMKARRTNTGYTTYGTGTFKITINGQETTSSKSYSINSNESVIMTATINVPHNNDGTKTITIAGEYSGDSPIGGNGSQSVTLDTIARASDITLSSSNVTMGNNLTITITRASSSFTHNIFYHFGSLTWQNIATNVATSKTWTVPINLANQIPNATTGIATIVVETYNGNTYIGTKTKTLNLTVPSNVKPTISSVNLVEAVSGLANQFGVYVQNKSKITGTITATGTYGSTITKYSTNINDSVYASSSFTTDLLRTSGSNTAVVTVTDSRGRTTTQNVTFNVTAYSEPNIETFTVTRDDTTPTTVAVVVKASITDVNSHNTYSYKIKYKKKSQSAYTSQTITGTTSVDTTVTLTNIDENATYDFMLEVKDYFSTITSIKSLSTAFTLMDFRDTGKGLGLGKVSERDALEIAMDIYLTKELYKNGQTLDTIIANAINTAISDTITPAINSAVADKTEQTIYDTAIEIQSASYKTLTGMPNLTNYVGKTVNIYVKYNGDQSKKYSFIVGNNPLWIEYTRNFNSGDVWHTLFKIENINSTSWKISTIKSYVIDTTITDVAITASNYKFYIDKITIN